MGRRNRTRKTKWRQFSLGSASGHDEEEDEHQVEQRPQQQQQQQPLSEDQQESPEEQLEESRGTSRSSSASCVPTEQAKDFQGHQRPRRPYYRAYHSHNQWNYGHVTNGNAEEYRATGVQLKIINDEEYTKISTPRQEVLLKKGSIGKKKMELTIPPVPAAQNDNDDTQNANGANLTPSLDSAGTEIQSPVYCYPMSYGGYCPQGIVMQEMYPGGPLVAAMPLALPMQPIYPYYFEETFNENPEVDNVNEKSRRNSGDLSQASGSAHDSSGSSENSESSSPEPLSPVLETQDPISALSKVPMPVLQYPPLVYVYPAGYALAQPVYTNG